MDTPIMEYPALKQELTEMFDRLVVLGCRPLEYWHTRFPQLALVERTLSQEPERKPDETRDTDLPAPK